MAKLTVREDEVYRLAVHGLSNDDIATSLGISRRTVETHMRAVLRKVGASRRSQLAMLDQRDNKITNRPSGLQSVGVANKYDVPLSQPRRGLEDCERQLRGYVAAVDGLLHRHLSLFRERVELTLIVGEQDGQDIVVERRWTRPMPYLVYRILGPIVTWPDGPPFELEDLAHACYVEGKDTQVEVHPVQDVNGRPLLMVLFAPGLHDDTETEWVLRYRSPRLWNPLRSSGQDSLDWATATFDPRRPATTSDLTLKVVFPASWTAQRLTERSDLGVIHTECLPTGQTQVTWRHDTPHAGAYHWVLYGSTAG